MLRTLKGVLGLSFVLCLCWTSPPDDEQKIERARETLKRARTNLDQSRHALKQIYWSLEDEFERIAGSYADSYLQGLDRAWIKAPAEIISKWEAGGKTLDQINRRTFRDLARPHLEEAGLRVLQIDTRLLRPLVNEVIPFLYDKIKKNEPLEAGDVVMELSDVLSPDLEFHLFWNAWLYTEIDEARAFARANEQMEEAQLELDRLEHPELYTIRGKRAPSRMVYIPGGIYYVGPNTGWERPRRRISLREFYIDRYEITNQEYRDFLTAQPPELYNDLVPYFWPMNVNMERTYPEDKASHPVNGVSWKAADAYARWIGKRLPTEEEWEVAAGGKNGFAYPWGNSFESGKANTYEDGRNATAEVGNYPSGTSPFGCMDMAGNVWEWTATDQDGNQVEDPDDKVRNMVIRGGDYKETADHARCDFRWMAPMDPYAGRNPRKKVIGFRCVKKVD
jgi:formylglycine-generating enzyme required for sulfatase activity